MNIKLQRDGDFNTPEITRGATKAPLPEDNPEKLIMTDSKSKKRMWGKLWEK
jgi:hypothetical protein